MRARPLLAGGSPAAPAPAPEAGEEDASGWCSDFLGVSVGKPREFFEIRSDCVPIARVYLLTLFSQGFLSFRRWWHRSPQGVLAKGT